MLPLDAPQTPKMAAAEGSKADHWALTGRSLRLAFEGRIHAACRLHPCWPPPPGTPPLVLPLLLLLLGRRSGTKMAQVAPSSLLPCSSPPPAPPRKALQPCQSVAWERAANGHSDSETPLGRCSLPTRGLSPRRAKVEL